MEQSDWQYHRPPQQQQRQQKMPETPPHQNVRRYSQQPGPTSQPQQMSSQQSQSSSTSQPYSYTTPTQSTASPSHRHSITSDFGSINLRDDNHAAQEKSSRPNLSLHPSSVRSIPSTHQGSGLSSPTRQTAPYSSNSSYSITPTRPSIGRTTNEHYAGQSSNSRHSSPMHSASPTMSPYYPTTPHILNPIDEKEQTMQWTANPSQARSSPSRAPQYGYPPNRDSVSPRTQLHAQASPSINRHSLSHVPTYEKPQYSPRQPSHFPTTPSISPTSYSPRHATFAMNRDAGSMMSDIVYSNPPPAKFRVVQSTADLHPIVNEQPKYRRANPDGGFISPIQALTMHLPTTYRLCNDKFQYESSRNPRRCLTKPGKGVKNEGFDNEDSDYILNVNDILGQDQGHKYLILDILGQGTFAQVVKCQNMKTMEVVAVKVVKNKPAYFNQGTMEVSILEILNNEVDPNDEHHILRLRDKFIQKGHLCLVFELLSVNLYELIKQNQYRGLGLNLVRVFSGQLLDAMCVLKDARIIHCDLKPENILLTAEESPTIKVVDFGSACHERHTVFTYIQSRFYRSPEVMLGLPYSCAIDMWSVGCIIVELFLGLPLFPGSSEYNQIGRIVEMFGMPPGWMIDVGKQAGEFFEKRRDAEGVKTYKFKSIEQYSREHNTTEQPSKKYFRGTLLHEIIQGYDRDKSSSSSSKPETQAAERHRREIFIDFVSGLLRINPLERWTPQQARGHPFITEAEWTGPYNPLTDNRYTPSNSSSRQAKSQSMSHISQPDSRGRRLEQPKHPATYEQLPRYEAAPVSYEPIHPPPQPPPAYYSPRHAPAQPPHHPPAQFLPQPQPHAYLPQPHITHAPQMLSVYPASQEWDPHRQQRVRDQRPRASTIGNLGDAVPLQIRQATQRIDPTQIRPSPVYYPPHDIDGILAEDGTEDSTSRNLYAMHGGYDQGMRPRKKSQSNVQGMNYHPGQVPQARVQQPQGQGQMLVPPQQNLFRGSARALEDGLMPPWQ